LAAWPLGGAGVVAWPVSPSESGHLALLASFSTQSNVKLCCVVEAKTLCRGLAEHMGTRSDGDTSFVKKSSYSKFRFLEKMIVIKCGL
jgi:hypothetical protein